MIAPQAHPSPTHPRLRDLKYTPTLRWRAEGAQKLGLPETSENGSSKDPLFVHYSIYDARLAR